MSYKIFCCSLSDFGYFWSYYDRPLIASSFLLSLSLKTVLVCFGGLCGNFPLWFFRPESGFWLF